MGLHGCNLYSILDQLKQTAAWAYDLKPIWGGTKFLPEKFVTVIVSPKKKRSSPVSLHLIYYFWTKHAIKRGSKVVLTFFFGDAITETNFSAKIYGHLLKLPEKLKVAQNFYSNCPKNYKLPEFKGGQCPPGPPTSYAYGLPFHRAEF